MLLSGGAPTFIRAEPSGRTRRHHHRRGAPSLWQPAAKIAAQHLAPYLANHGHRADQSDELLDLDEVPAETDIDVDAEHRAGVDLALALADADASWEDYDFALEWLDRVEALDGVLPREYEEKRARWARERALQEGR